MKKFEVKGAQKLDRIHSIVGGMVTTGEIGEIDPNCQICGLGGPFPPDAE